MGKPWYQRIAEGLAAALGVFLLLGAALDSITNATTLISRQLTYFGSLAWISTEDCSPKRGAVFGGPNTWSERRGAPGTCGSWGSRLLKEAADLLMSFGALRRIRWKHTVSLLFWWLESTQSFLAFKNGHDSDIATRFAFHAVGVRPRPQSATFAAISAPVL